MELSETASRLLDEIERLSDSNLLNNNQYWEARMDSMNPCNQRVTFEALEELEAEGHIVMCIKEREGLCPIPKKIVYKR